MNRTTQSVAGLRGSVILLFIVLLVAAGIRPGSGAQGDTAKAKRRADLQAIARAYFDGLAQHDLSKFPYADNVSLRAPLNPNGGADNPIVGKNNVLAFFAKVLPAVALH